VRVGQTVHVAVRPERIVVETAESVDAAGANEAFGAIRDVAFLGNQSRLTVELASGKLVTAVRLNPGEAAEALRPGSRVRLRWAARDCRGLVS
jgi:ABC-type Fe3+/spermidine/putrescine transport system ATPase subunit